jgi:hypothetical protein
MNADPRQEPSMTAQTRSHRTSLPQPSVPAEAWWRVGMVWLVLGGPAVVVVAAIATAVIAVRGADRVVTDTQRPAATAPVSELPAVQGRNLATTPR